MMSGWAYIIVEENTEYFSVHTQSNNVPWYEEKKNPFKIKAEFKHEECGETNGD